MLPGWREVVVWDLPTRLFHWLTVGLVAVLYVTERLNWMDWHIWAGEVLLALVLFRLIWGVLGSETARFSHFIASPFATLRHLKHLSHREPDTGIGHNAAGGWMVLLLIALLLVQCLSGIYVNNDVANEGYWTEIVPAPVANAISDAHVWVWDILCVAMSLHVLAIAIYTFGKRHNLVLPMVTGRKRLPETLAAPRISGRWRVAVAGVIALAATVSISIYL